MALEKNPTAVAPGRLGAGERKTEGLEKSAKPTQQSALLAQLNYMDNPLEERMAQMERAYGTQSELMRELRDAVTATAYMEARQATALKEHAEWLVGHDKAIQAARERADALDRRIGDLVSGMGAFMRGGQA